MNAAKSEQSGLISMGKDKLVRQTYLGMESECFVGNLSRKAFVFSL